MYFRTSSKYLTRCRTIIGRTLICIFSKNCIFRLNPCKKSLVLRDSFGDLFCILPRLCALKQINSNINHNWWKSILRANSYFLPLFPVWYKIGHSIFPLDCWKTFMLWDQTRIDEILSKNEGNRNKNAPSEVIPTQWVFHWNLFNWMGFASKANLYLG